MKVLRLGKAERAIGDWSQPAWARIPGPLPTGCNFSGPQFPIFKPEKEQPWLPV